MSGGHLADTTAQGHINDYALLPLAEAHTLDDDELSCYDAGTSPRLPSLAVRLFRARVKEGVFATRLRCARRPVGQCTHARMPYHFASR